jgi:glycosyltransferase involved in cell wall biosynthesis
MKVVLSLGRLHPLKGLDLLVSAWAEVVRSSKVLKCESAKVADECTDTGMHAKNFRTLELPNFRTSSWQLVIAGPDEQGTKEKLKRQSETLKLKWCECAGMDACECEADIIFVGSVQGEEKWALMHRADIFMLPSRSENFGMVVGEALSCGVPVVTTAVGPWGESGEVLKFESSKVLKFESSKARRGDELPLARVDEKRGLIIVETSAEGISEGLRRMMALSDAERKEMGRQGCEWVKREFNWESVAKQMLEAYGSA